MSDDEFSFIFFVPLIVCHKQGKQNACLLPKDDKPDTYVLHIDCSLPSCYLLHRLTSLLNCFFFFKDEKCQKESNVPYRCSIWFDCQDCVRLTMPGLNELDFFSATDTALPFSY